MTREEQAKAYHEKIITENPQAEAWDFESAYLAGYDTAKIEDTEVIAKARQKFISHAWKLVCDAYAKGYNREPMTSLEKFEKYWKESI